MAFNALDTIMKFETGGKNVNNYLYGQPGRTASGYFQMVDSTWKRWSAGAGVSGYARAIDAPYEVQRQVAGYGFSKEGFTPWTCEGCNSPLRNYVNQQGGAGAFSLDSSGSGTNYSPSYDNFSQNGAFRTENIGGNGLDDPYSFSSTNAGGYEVPGGEMGQGVAEWGATFADGALGTGNPLTMTIKKLAGKVGIGSAGTGSQTVPQAIDKQTAQDAKDTQSTLKTATDMFTKTGASLSDYIARIIFVVVGLVIFAAALRLFGSPVQMVKNVAKLK